MRENTMIGNLPKAFELQGLRRLKEALVGSEARHGKPGRIPAEDWLAELDAKITGLERASALIADTAINSRHPHGGGGSTA
jgi:hypothetical protein